MELIIDRLISNKKVNLVQLKIYLVFKILKCLSLNSSFFEKLIDYEAQITVNHPNKYVNSYRKKLVERRNSRVDITKKFEILSISSLTRRDSDLSATYKSSFQSKKSTTVLMGQAFIDQPKHLPGHTEDPPEQNENPSEVTIFKKLISCCVSE